MPCSPQEMRKKWLQKPETFLISACSGFVLVIPLGPQQFVLLPSFYSISSVSRTLHILERSKSGCSTARGSLVVVYVTQVSSVSLTSLDMSEDPYVMEEEEPSESRALESCLWEIQVRRQTRNICTWYGLLAAFPRPPHALAMGSPTWTQLLAYVLRMR